MSSERPSRRTAVARWSALVSLGLALAAAIFVLFVPLGTTVTEQTPEGGVEHRIERRTLLESEGTTAIPVAVAPVAVAAIPVIAGGRRSARAARIGAAVLLAMLAGGLAVSVGLFYAPAAIAMIVAAVAG